MTITEFINTHAIAMISERIPSRPDNVGWDDNHLTSHWRVTLKRGRKSMSTYFSMGSAHTDPPTTEMVLNSLASDASGLDVANSGWNPERIFASWAGEYGYDPDSRAAMRVFKAVVSINKKLRRLLGEGPYSTLVWDTERE